MPLAYLILHLDFRQLDYCEPNQPIGFANNETRIQQKYTPDDDDIAAFGFKPIKYSSLVGDYLLVEILNDQERKIWEKRISNLPLEDNQINYFKLPKNLLQKNKTYTFVFSRPELSDDKEPIALAGSQTNCIGGQLMVNSRKAKGSLAMNFKIEKYEFPENIKVLTNRLSQYKPFFVKGKNMAAILFLYEVLIFILSLILAKSYFSGKSEE